MKRSNAVVGMVALLLLLALSIAPIPALLKCMGASLAKLHNWIYWGGSAGAGTLTGGRSKSGGRSRSSICAGLCPALWPCRVLRPSGASARGWKGAATAVTPIAKEASLVIRRCWHRPATDAR